MKVKITESQLSRAIHKYLQIRLKGFDNCNYDWADFGCGLGVCCDPYAVGFVLPDNSNYDDYLFKLVDSEFYNAKGDYPEELKGDLPDVCKSPPHIQYGEFDTIVIYEELYEKIKNLFGPIDIWHDSLLTILNITYGFNARDIIYDW